MNLTMTIIISVIFGLIPEVTYFTLFLKYTKNLKDKILKLWFLIAIIYVVCMFIQRYKIAYYILFIALVYFILKLLYKKKVQIIDVFTFSISTIYLSLIGFICSRVVNNSYILYYIMLLLNRILLFVPFLYKQYFNKIYIKYCKLWNRDYRKKQPIKSITLRNFSLICLNIFIFIMNIISVSMTNFIK